MRPDLDKVDRELASLRGVDVTSAARRRIVDGTLAKLEPKRRAWKGWSLAAVAACAALLVARETTEPPVTDGSESERIAERTIRIGEHRVVVEDQSVAEVRNADPHAAALTLAAGRLEARVKKLAPGETFRVQTPELLVEVVGTHFAVHTVPGCSDVAVTEGRVRVTELATNAVHFVDAGKSFSTCERTPQQGEITAVAPVSEPDRPQVERAAPGEALVRRALGQIEDPAHRSEAVRSLEQYLRLYPRGLFEEEARFYLFVAAAHGEDSRLARRRAEEFVARFPRRARATKVRSWLHGPLDEP